MEKLGMWSVCLLLIHLVSQYEGLEYYERRTFFSTFMSPSITPSAYVDAEEKYMNTYNQIVELDAFVQKMNDSDLDANTNQMRDFADSILGKPKIIQNNVTHPEDGIIRQLKFYHIQRIFDPDSYLNHGIEKRNELLYNRAKKGQVELARWFTLFTQCKDLLVYIIDIFDSVEDVYNVFEKYKEFDFYYANGFLVCTENNNQTKDLLASMSTNKRESVIYSTYRDALFLFFDTIMYALEFSKVGQFNGQRAAPAGAQLGPIEQMWYETLRSGKEIEKGLKTIKDRSIRDPAKWQGIYNSLLDIISNRNPDWKMQDLYTNISDSIKIEDSLINARKAEVDELHRNVSPIAKEYIKNYWSNYKHNLNSFRDAVNTTDFNEKYFSGGVVPVWNKTETSNGSYKVALGRENFNNSAPFQNLFLAWKEFNRLNAKIKCHLKTNFWDFLLPEAIKKSQQPLWRVFGGISKTMFEPCSHNDTDLIGTCTKENHEICMPMKYTNKLVDKMDEDEEMAYLYLKPDYVFRPVILPNGTMICEETEAYAVPLSICRCGFRTDCGKDLGKNLTCVLKVNDNFRKQCKGSIGYPCKTLPFGPGRHHESCITGYCNMRLNSCEEDPKYYPLIYSGQHRADEI